MELINFLTTYGQWGAYTLIVFGLIYDRNAKVKEISALKKNEVIIRAAHQKEITDLKKK